MRAVVPPRKQLCRGPALQRVRVKRDPGDPLVYDTDRLRRCNAENCGDQTLPGSRTGKKYKQVWNFLLSACLLNSQSWFSCSHFWQEAPSCRATPRAREALRGVPVGQPHRSESGPRAERSESGPSTASFIHTTSVPPWHRWSIAVFCGATRVAVITGESRGFQGWH